MKSIRRQQARILIAGCGYIGGALAQRLVTGPHEVWGLRRRPMMMPLGVEPIEADLAVARTLRDLPPRLDFVIYSKDVARLKRNYVLDTMELPDEILEQHGLERTDSLVASDHLAMVTDFKVKKK